MSGIWPGDTRIVVFLTFDVDGEALWLGRDPSSAHRPGIRSQGEYGPVTAMPRILDMLDRFDIKATFFIPGYEVEHHPQLVQDIVRRGHEIGHHGYLHEPPASLTAQQEEELLDRAVGIIETLTGTKVVGNRSCSLDPSERTLQFLADRGFVYDSSLLTGDAPYLVDAGDGRNLVELPTRWEIGDAPYFPYVPYLGVRSTLSSQDAVYSVWKEAFYYLHALGDSSFSLLTHPQYSGRPSRLSMLERFIGYMRSSSHVEFMRMVDGAQLWQRENVKRD